MPEDPDDRGPQHTGEVPPQPNEPAWKKRKPGEIKPIKPDSSQEEEERTVRPKKRDADKQAPP